MTVRPGVVAEVGSGSNQANRRSVHDARGRKILFLKGAFGQESVRTIYSVQSSGDTENRRGQTGGPEKSEQRRSALGPSSLRVHMFSKVCIPGMKCAAMMSKLSP